MNTVSPLKTRFTSLIGVELPFANAGMGPFARAPLAAAVSNAGGLGTLGAPQWPIEELVGLIDETRSLTDRPIAMNIICEFHGPDVIEAVIATGIAAIATGWGDPAPIVEAAHGGGVKVMHRCVSADEAADAAAAGVDLIIAQGRDAGGHTGELPGMGLLPAVVDAAAGVPVLYAGGVGDGRGLLAALALGAEGAILGTRFVASEEAYANDAYKTGLVKATETDSVDTYLYGQREWPGAPTRALRNSTLRAYEAEAEPRTPVLDRPLEVVATRHLPGGDVEIPRYYLDAPLPEDEGDLEGMAMYAGTSVGTVKDIAPVAVIVERLMREADDAWLRLAGLRG
ncbi:MAG: nitronate monooxygenase [Actinobacteria bacterium]|nr:nitronate monooxygenase [Actinomycetota bacterium]